MNGQGIVTKLKGDKARVRVTGDPGGGCPSCAARHQCHPDGGSSGREITVLNDYGANVSDRVAFEADSGKVILSAALIWLLPIFAMFIGYLAGQHFGGGFIPIGSALLFLAASYLLLRLIDQVVAGGKTFYPRITTVLGDENTPSSCELRESGE